MGINNYTYSGYNNYTYSGYNNYTYSGYTYSGYKFLSISSPVASSLVPSLSCLWRAWYQPFAHVQEFYRKLCNLYSFSKFEFPSACYVTSDDVMPNSFSLDSAFSTLCRDLELLVWI